MIGPYSGPAVWISAVDPSTSANRKVTVPAGSVRTRQV
jgi:hypothetical protein